MTTKSPTDAAAALEAEPLAYGALLRENVIKVEIGPNHTEYYVHPGLLSHHSEYFKRALNGSWKEAEDWVIMLEDVECTTFEIFLEWLYSQQYPKDHRFGSANQNRTKRLGRVKACAFGDRFMAPAFRAASESALIDDLVLKGGAPFYELITYAYGNLPSDSPVLRALVDAHCYGFTETADTDKNGELVRRSELPQAFLVEVMVRYMRLQPTMSSRKRLDRCDYHSHAPKDRKGQSCQVPRIDDFKGDLSKKF